MHQVSPTPDRTPLCSGRGEKARWDWRGLNPQVFPGLGYRESSPAEKANQVQVPKDIEPRTLCREGEDIEGGRRHRASKGGKPSTPFTTTKIGRTWNPAKWRMERADIREDLDKVRHDTVYQERGVGSEERPRAARSGEFWRPNTQVLTN